MKPSDGVDGVRGFILETVKMAGGNPCPPIIVGVGGTFDYVAFLVKKSLLRKIGERNRDPEIAAMEEKWLLEVNKLGIGPAGPGPEALRKLRVCDMPVIVINDCYGGDLYLEDVKKYSLDVNLWQ